MKTSAICSMGVVVLMISATLHTSVNAAEATGPRVRTLVLQPSRFEAGQSHSLLVNPEREGDAASLYGKAVEKMPQNMNSGQVRDWTQVPLDELPQDEVQAFLQRAQPCLDTIAQAIACKECNWPPFEPGAMPSDLSEYRLLTFMISVKARLEIVQQRHGDTVATLRTGLTMAKQIGEAPTLVQSLVGIAMAAVMVRGVDDLAQAPGSPSLYAALKDLPRPLIDVEKPITSELKALETNTQYTDEVREVMRKHVQPAYKRVRQIAQRLDSDIAVRQCIEALRHYAATHDGTLPADLGDITDIALPHDPVTQKPFAYRLEGNQAVLETSPPEGGGPREATRFEITVAR